MHLTCIHAGERQYRDVLAGVRRSPKRDAMDGRYRLKVRGQVAQLGKAGISQMSSGHLRRRAPGHGRPGRGVRKSLCLAKDGM